MGAGLKGIMAIVIMLKTFSDFIIWSNIILGLLALVFCLVLLVFIALELRQLRRRRKEIENASAS